MAVIRFGISLEKPLLERFDRQIRKKGYASRSEAIRDLIRDSLVTEEWESATAETVGTITIVYSHETHELTDTLTDLQHRYFYSIISQGSGEIPEKGGRYQRNSQVKIRAGWCSEFQRTPITPPPTARRLKARTTQ